MSDTFETLKNNILAAKENKAPAPASAPESTSSENANPEPKNPNPVPKEPPAISAGSPSDEGYSQEATESREKLKNKGTLVFRRGDEVFEVPEDAEIELVADKGKNKLLAKEMRDATSGSVAVRNRMRELAEQKKQITSVFKDFAKESKNDPMRALEKFIQKVAETDEGSDLSYSGYLEALSEQARKLSEMSETELEAMKLKKDLEETKEVLNQKEYLAKINQKATSLMRETGIDEVQLEHLSNQILSNEAIAQTVTNPEELLDRVGELVTEIGAQQACEKALRKFNADLSPRDPVIRELSRHLKANPDWEPEDLEEVAREISGYSKRKSVASRASEKVRMAGADSYERQKNLTTFDVLREKLLEKKKLQKTAKN